MALKMPSPQKHRKTGVYWFRQRVPEDLRTVVGKLEVTRTLGTKDHAEAKILHGAVMAEVAAQWANLRVGQQGLSHKEIQALSGEFYRELIKAHEDEPGSVDAWTRTLAGDRYIMQVRKSRPGALFGRFGVDAMAFLKKRGILVSTTDLMRFVTAVSEAKIQAHEQLLSNARGDYRPHPEANRFPALVVPKPEHQFEAMWADYVADRKPSPKTVRGYHKKLLELTRFVGKTDMAAIQEDDLLRWRDALEKRPGLKTITIRDGYVAAAKAIFGWAVFKKKLPINPAAGVNVTVIAKDSLKMRGFSDREAATILSASLAPPGALMSVENAAARRWVPWLCAYTGARVNEITQLRASDVMEHEDVWIIRISPEAGSVKTGEPRLVALHPHLLEQGFVRFSFSKSGDAPLFYVPARKASGDAARAKYESVGNRLADWIRGLGIVDPRVAPNHGWRHRYKTLRRRHGIDKEVIDAVQGHAPATEGDHYGETEVAAMLREISKLPRYEVEPAGVIDRRRKPAKAKPTKQRVKRLRNG